MDLEGAEDRILIKGTGKEEESKVAKAPREKTWREQRREEAIAEEMEQRRLEREREVRAYTEVYNIRKCTFYPLHMRIRGEGHCFWDSLRFLGISEADLAVAAAHPTMALQVDQHVVIDQDILTNFFNQLQLRLGTGLRVYIINVAYRDYDRAHATGVFHFRAAAAEGHPTRKLILAIFTDPDGNGHFVPEGK